MRGNSLSLTLLILMFYADNSVLRVLTVKIDEIEWFNLQKTHAVERMNHGVKPL